MDIKEILNHDETFRYRLLSRMQMDCNYYLGHGNRYPNHLWAGNEKDQIACMKALWESFPKDGKPEWLSFEDICNYAKQMGVEQPSLADQIKSAEVRSQNQDIGSEPVVQEPTR